MHPLLPTMLLSICWLIVAIAWPSYVAAFEQQYAGSSRYQLAAQVKVQPLIAIDGNANLTAAMAQSKAAEQSPLDNVLRPHKKQNSSWYRLSIDQPVRNALLVLTDTIDASYELYLPNGQSWRQSLMEANVPYPEYSRHTMVFKLPELSLGGELYLRAQGQRSVPVRAMLVDQSGYLMHDQQVSRFITFCVTSMLAFALLGAIFYGLIRDQLSGLFALALFFNGSYFLFSMGEAAHWLGYNLLWPYGRECSVLFGVLAFLFMLSFYRHMLALAQSQPRIDKLVRSALYLQGLLLLIFILARMLTSDQTLANFAVSLMNLLILVSSLGIMLIMARSWWLGNKQAPILLSSTLILSLGSALRAAQFSGNSALDWSWTVHVLGAAISSCLMAYALAKRFMELRAERDQAQRLASTDALTGALNRLGGLTQAQLSFNRCKAANLEFAVAVLDLDHFKRINDTYGHDIGDKTLVNFVRVAKAELPNECLLMRLGGEEFVVMLPNYAAQKALALLESLRTAVQSKIQVVGQTQVNLTVSIGVNAMHSRHQDFETLLNEADQAVYYAKQNGRNQVATYAQSLAAKRAAETQFVPQSPSHESRGLL